jgi:hypothetical protein
MRSANDSIDLLLLNCSNLPFIPVFPYAFVQLGALATRRGIKTKALDLTSLPEEQRRATIEDLIERYHPRAIGFTLRQLDSIIADQYLPGAHAGDRTPPPSSLNLFPLETTRDAIVEVRSLTDAPVVVGGAGFSTSPIEISKYLEVDLGVRGEPDGFLDKFDAVLNGEALASTPNLIYRSGKGYVESRHCFFEPFDNMEYNEAVIRDLEQFYGKETLFSSGPPSSVPLPSTRPSIPVEVSRGCPFHCCYCAEPMTNGTEVRHRLLDAIAEDIQFLASRGLRYLWLVCSELNTGSNEFALLIAEEITRINEQLAEDPIVWRSYHLPRWLSAEDLRLLYRSGFLGGRNDFPAWDDGNLAANSVPYRTEHILGYLRDLRAVETERGIETEGCSVFFGNPHANAKSISRTLRLYDDHGFAEYYGQLGFGFRATRVFDCCFDHLPMTKHQITTVTREGVTPTNLIHPSFHVPDHLLTALGGIEETFEFFEFAPHVVLSRRALRDKDWADFLSRTSNPEQFSSLLRKVEEGYLGSGFLDAPETDPRIAALVRDIYQDPTPSALQSVFEPPPNEKQLLNDVSSVLLEAIYSHHCACLEGVLEFLQLPSGPEGLASFSTYKLIEKLYAQYSSTHALVKAVQIHFRLDDDSAEMFLLNYLLFLYHVRIRPEYTELLFGPVER